MLFNLAQAATTVVETVTVTPPNVPVEIVKQPSSGWGAKDILSPVIALFALGVSIFTWRGQAPRGRLTVHSVTTKDDHGRQCYILQLFNRGRMEMSVGCPLFIVDLWWRRKDKRVQNWAPIREIGEFPVIGDYDVGLRIVPPLQYIAGDTPIRELYDFVKENRVAPRQVRVTVLASGKVYKAKLSKEVIRAVNEYKPDSEDWIAT